MSEEERDELLGTLDAARESFQHFVEHWSRLGRLIRPHSEWLWHRVEAYPGWHVTRDQGSSQSMAEWMDEVEKFIEEEAR